METAPFRRMSPGQRAIAVLWPSFVAAAAATGLFFSAFNPRDLAPFNLDLDISPLAAYSVGFFIFWLFGIICGYGTLYFTLVNSGAVGQRDV